MMFDIKDNTPYITPEGLFVPEMRSIWDSDPTPNKDIATPVLIYIYHMANPDSVYFNIPEEDKHQVITNDYIQDKDWIPDEQVLQAIDKYKFLLSTPLQRLYESTSIAMDKVSKALKEEEVDMSKQGNMGSFNSLLEKGVKYAESYIKLKDISAKERAANKNIKGGIKPSIIL